MKHLLGSLLALACWSLCMAALPPKDEPKFREQLRLDGFKTVIYRNLDGSELSFEQFYDIVASGQSFSMTKDPNQSTAVVKILDKSQLPNADKLRVKPGELMPEPRLRDLEGRSVELHARGNRPLLMNFFFAECAPCIAEIPVLNEFKQAHPDIDVVGVTYDEAPEAHQFIAKHRFAWPVVADGASFKDKVGIKSYPAFAYIGKDGKVLEICGSARIARGGLTAAALDAWVRGFESPSAAQRPQQ